ncbi:MAG: hypothetical protein R3C49_07630 [Planctomycetaceae bacterium]
MIFRLKSVLCTVPAVLFLLLSASFVAAADPVSLIDSQKPMGGWTFDNGQEFPGAVGKLELLNDDDQPTLKLHGDFSGGGNYVQAARLLEPVSMDSVGFDIRVPAGVSKVTTRLIDGTGQCHQLDVRLNDKGGWQRYSFPVARYFQSLEAGAPMDIVTRYEKWGGANDGRWHQPLKLLVFLAGRDALSDGSISLRNINLIPTPPTTSVETSIRLDDFLPTGTAPWEYNNGDEFPGARGTLSVTSDHPKGLQLKADFSNGGRYVGLRRHLKTAGITNTARVRFQARSTSVNRFSVRFVDETDQCHQRGGLPMVADGQWHDVELVAEKIAGGEHWSGANDGKWHGALKLVELMLSTGSSDTPSMQLELRNLIADVTVEAQETSEAWTPSLASPDGWQTEGSVSVGAFFDADRGLVLKRTLEERQTPTVAVSPEFDVNRGAWRVHYRQRSDLHSPDNSFHVGAELELLDENRQIVETIPLGICFGKQDWSTVEQTATVPRRARFGRIRFQLNKTWGTCAFSDLSAMRLQVQPLEPTIQDIRISSNAIGNLFLPEQTPELTVTVNTLKPLADADLQLSYTVQDYCGQTLTSAVVSLSGIDANRYVANVTLPEQKLNVGQFYELHVEVPQGIGSAVKEFSGFAILPPAATHRYQPEKIPFTIRNWDSRIPDYFALADRLGLRMLGVWGGWSNQPPYEPHLPGLDICEKLGANWVTGTPASDVERNGFKNVTEESLREGMTNFLKAYAHRGLAMIAQGNEPHGTEQVVLDNVRAYRAIYEAVKAFDAKIEVIGTSVEPNEEYFKAGYQNFLDSYDFHVYEHYTAVRETMQQYRRLMEKYDAIKPIHSTELGLNSAGQARLAVAVELIKKCTVFFAEGGKTVSWFTIQYPDPKGTARGQFGDAHCVFDCKFNHYNPRLDAIAYYNMINLLTDKMFVSEDQRKDGSQVFLFRKSASDWLQVVWNDQQSADIRLPAVGAKTVDVVRVDGFRTQQNVREGTIDVAVGIEPLLIVPHN